MSRVQAPLVAASRRRRLGGGVVCPDHRSDRRRDAVAAVLLFQSGRCRGARRQMVRRRHDLEASLDHADRGDARLRHRLGRRRPDRLLVRPAAARRRGVRSLRQDDQRAAARRAGADLHAVVRPRHLVEGRARRHARVLHRVLQRLSGRQGGEPDRARQRPHARHERPPAHAPRLLAVGAVVDVLVAAHLGRALPWSARWSANISARRPGSAI